ncbi:hypothetical protein ET495_10860 [Xylanimonas allomyrinae]|uniref:Uncharacterized protein n=1 Tax=Xylanimonas allomyrinae TaxID=2509459 RepID=A0A4P6EMK2_9MICO|nr:hypothetical protein [Xylanimonas allomyrinae]QAY63665.1 hypothetical protein ET495_10860 [Xylanimonas allomyrinae]
MTTFWAIAAGVAPSVGVGLIFWFAMRKIVRADRNEREALARLDAEDAARFIAEREGRASGRS